jgi:hypothetical protein
VRADVRDDRALELGVLLAAVTDHVPANSPMQHM